MVARNDITGDAIQTKSASQAFRDNYDAIFRKDKKMDEPTKCGCGRSLTGFCVGWHGLSEEEFQVRLAEHLERHEKLEQERLKNESRK